MEGCRLGTASASSVGASQQKALVFSAWSHLWKKSRQCSWEEGRESVPISPVQSSCNYGLIFLTAENTVAKDAA